MPLLVIAHHGVQERYDLAHAGGDGNLLVFARLGGDEFSVLLTDTTIEPVKDIIARFRQSIENYNKEASCGYNISFSYGIVTIDYEKDYSIDALLSQADSLMYEYKDNYRGDRKE